MKHAEHVLQTSCVRVFRGTYPKYAGLLFAIPNGAKLAGNALQRAKAWKRLEAEGARPGVADLFLAVPSGKYAGLFVEMKTATGRQTAQQKEFQRDIQAAGYGYVVPRTLEEFITAVKNYLQSGTVGLIIVYLCLN